MSHQSAGRACIGATFALVAIFTVGPARAATGPEPLTKADIALYLKVMKAAASRVRQPTAIDQALAQRAEEVQRHQRTVYKEFAEKHKDGSKASSAEIAGLNASNPAGADLEAIRHTAALRSAADSLIVQEQKIDRRYWVVKQTIERSLAWLEAAEAHPQAVARKPDFGRLSPDAAAQARQIWEIDQKNLALVKPHEREMEQLMRAVNPGRELDND